MAAETNLAPCDRRRILVADDEKNICHVFRMLLSNHLPGCRIDVAVNGMEAVQLFREVHHGALIMDLKMPVMDGLTAFHEIQGICENENWEMPSVVFCTGYDPPDGVQKIIADNPAHSLLRKPVNEETLVGALKPHLSLD